MTKTETVGSVYIEDERVEYVIENLNCLVDKIPDEYKKSARLEKEHDYDGSSVSWYVRYDRLLNEEELKQNDRQKKAAIAREIQQLRELKKKYPDIN